MLKYGMYTGAKEADGEAAGYYLVLLGLRQSGIKLIIIAISFAPLSSKCGELAIRNAEAGRRISRILGRAAS